MRARRAPARAACGRVLLVAALATVACAAPRTPGSDPPPTRITRFVPVMPPGAPRDGKCWTVSIAAPRAGAWRCMLGNEIADPCFTLAEAKGVVVCGANPAVGDPGFAVHLTEPLPGDVPTPSVGAAPWLLRLANGQVCAPFTGTVPVVDGREARWSCADAGTRAGPGLITAIDRGTTWTARWYPASEGRSPARAEPSAVPPRSLEVTDVWE